jgi:hypothetical protein
MTTVQLEKAQGKKVEAKEKEKGSNAMAEFAPS